MASDGTAAASAAAESRLFETAAERAAIRRLSLRSTATPPLRTSTRVLSKSAPRGRGEGGPITTSDSMTFSCPAASDNIETAEAAAEIRTEHARYRTAGCPPLPTDQPLSKPDSLGLTNEHSNVTSEEPLLPLNLPERVCRVGWTHCLVRRVAALLTAPAAPTTLFKQLLPGEMAVVPEARRVWAFVPSAPKHPTPTIWCADEAAASLRRRRIKAGSGDGPPRASSDEPAAAPPATPSSVAATWGLRLRRWVAAGARKCCSIARVSPISVTPAVVQACRFRGMSSIPAVMLTHTCRCLLVAAESLDRGPAKHPRRGDSFTQPLDSPPAAAGEVNGGRSSGLDRIAKRSSWQDGQKRLITSIFFSSDRFKRSPLACICSAATSLGCTLACMRHPANSAD